MHRRLSFCFAALMLAVPTTSACGGGDGWAAAPAAPSAADQARAACMNDCNFAASACPPQMGASCNEMFQACANGCEIVAQQAAQQDAAQQQQQQEQPPQQVEQQQTALDHVISVLQSNGYTCTQEPYRYVCSNTSPAWEVAVAWIVEQDRITILYDSFQMRAFARPCAEFTNALNDLASSQDGYGVTCDDKLQAFKMTTSLNYGADLDVMGWMNNHLAKRNESYRLLDSIGAVRK